MTRRSGFDFKCLGALAVALALTTQGAQAAPDARLKAAADAAQPAVIDSLRQMVAIESGSLDLAGLAKMADYTEARLKAAGFATERRKSTRGAGADIVIGTRQGNGGHKLMLIGHMDTVYPSGILGSQPYKVDGNRVYGPGIADDKGGIVVVLHALDILYAQGWKDFGTITVLFNADEEVGSLGSGDLIADIAASHDYVLSYEPNGAKSVAKVESLLLAAAGTATAFLEVKGRSAHAGAAPELGRNALIELSHQLLQTRDVAKDIPGAQLNWTTSQGGQARNQIPEKAVAIGDVRLTAAGAEDKLTAALNQKIASSRLVPETETTLRMESGRPPFIAGPAGLALAQRAQAIYAELDNRPLALVPGTGGGTDAGYAGRSGKPVVMESFGLSGWGFHARDEYIEIDSIVPRLYLTTRLLMELGKK